MSGNVSGMQNVLMQLRKVRKSHSVAVVGLFIGGVFIAYLLAFRSVYIPTSFVGWSLNHMRKEITYGGHQGNSRCFTGEAKGFGCRVSSLLRVLWFSSYQAAGALVLP